MLKHMTTAAVWAAAVFSSLQRMVSLQGWSGVAEVLSVSETSHMQSRLLQLTW